MYTIRMTTLPLVTLVWTSEAALVAAGHDCQPLVFSGSQAGWQLVGSLDDPVAAKAAGGARGGASASPVGRLNSAAFNTFRNADSRGIGSAGGAGSGAGVGSAGEASELFTVHQNTIRSVRVYEGAGGEVARVSTSGVDGKLVVWDVGAVNPIGATGGLASRMGGMHLR